MGVAGAEVARGGMLASTATGTTAYGGRVGRGMAMLLAASAAAEARGGGAGGRGGSGSGSPLAKAEGAVGSCCRRLNGQQHDVVMGKVGWLTCLWVW